MFKLHSIARRSTSIILLATSAIFLIGCATTPAKPRERYAGVDAIDTLPPQMVTGKWQVRILNQTEDERESWQNTEMQSVTIFNEDGTMLNITKSGPMGLELHTSGKWSLSESLLTSAATSTENKSTNPLGAIAAGFLNSFKDNMSGTANVYEASESRLLVVNEEQGVALEYLRL